MTDDEIMREMRQTPVEASCRHWLYRFDEQRISPCAREALHDGDHASGYGQRFRRWQG